MEAIGDILREARHNKRASIEDASRATKIKPDILEQLEAGEFNKLASPTYTKGFLKLYAEYLGLDSASVVEAYLKSQGGLRRQGLQLETEATARQRPSRELQLNIGSVVMVVAGLTAAVAIIYAGHSWWTRRAARPAAPAPTAAVVPTKPAAPVAVAGKPATLPKAGFEAYYRPKKAVSSELLETPSSP
jgi:cytoskeletal protein RodZ